MDSIILKHALTAFMGFFAVIGTRSVRLIQSLG